MNRDARSFDPSAKPSNLAMCNCRNKTFRYKEFFWVVIGLLMLPASLVGQNTEKTLTLPPFGKVPVAGKRIKVFRRNFQPGDVFHTICLPDDWNEDWGVENKRYPVIVEFPGNRAPQLGSTGSVEHAALGYGISQGKFIWVTMPFIKHENEYAWTWWGNEDATIEYLQKHLPQILRRYGGDERKVFLCGFSRGAIAANYMGLYDDKVAKWWCGFITHDHFDGVREWRGTKWGSPLADYRKAAAERLKRIKGRPYLVCQNGGTKDIADYLKKQNVPLDNFTFVDVDTKSILGTFPNAIAKHPHTDRWLLKPSPSRNQVDAWVAKTLQQIDDSAAKFELDAKAKDIIKKLGEYRTTEWNDTSFGQLWKHVGYRGVTTLRDHPDSFIALQAVLERSCFGNSKNELPKTDKQTRALLTAIEKKLEVTCPQWWTKKVKRENFERSDSLIQGPFGLRTREGTKIFQAGESLAVKIGSDLVKLPEAIFAGKLDKKTKKLSLFTDHLVARFSDRFCFVTLHDSVGYPHDIFCIDRKTKRVAWKKKACGAWNRGATGSHVCRVEIVIEKERMIVFGAASTGYYLHGFEAKSGKELFRFSTRYRW